MPTNYTVIFKGGQHFGDEPNYFSGDASFVGRSKEFQFDCPGVNAGEDAVLMFQSRDVHSARNGIEINGFPVFNGIPVNPGIDNWQGNILIVVTDHQLKATGNILRIEAFDTSGGTSGNIDDFMLDNMVIMYKTQRTNPIFEP